MKDINDIRLENLKRLIKEKGFKSQSQFSDHVKRSKQQISNIMTGRDTFSTQLIEEFSKALGVDQSEFYRGLLDTLGSSDITTPAPTITISNKQDKPPTTELSILDETLYIMEHGEENHLAILKKTLNTIKNAIQQDVDRKKAHSLPKVTGTQENGEAMRRKAA